MRKKRERKRKIGNESERKKRKILAYAHA